MRVGRTPPCRSPTSTRGPTTSSAAYGSYLLAHRPHGRDLGLIDKSGRLAVQLRCPRAITSICVADGALVIAAGALICLEIDRLSPLMRTRGLAPAGGYPEPPVPEASRAG